MYETFKIMSANLPKNLQEKSLEELCDLYSKYDAIIQPYVQRKQEWDLKNKQLVEEYKMDTNPNKIKPDIVDYEKIEPKRIYKNEFKMRDLIYRTMYCKLYPMMLSVQKNYPTLSNAQRVEVTMMILISTLRCYSQNKKIKTKFSTYFCNNLKNGMMTQINSLKCTKRSVWLNIIGDEQQNDFILSNKTDKSQDSSLDYFFENLENSVALSTLEKSFVKCILHGFKKNEEISEHLQIKEKFNKYVTMTDPLHSNKLMDDEGELKLIKQIRKSVKNKCKKFGTGLFS